MNKEKHTEKEIKNSNVINTFAAITLLLIFAAIGLYLSLSYNTKSNFTDQSLRKSLDLLYETQSTEARQLLSKIDTTSLSPRQKAMYQLSLAYLHFQEKDAPSALEMLDNINYNEANHLPEETIAEINLINAIILEQIFLPDSAFFRHQNAMNYFEHHKEDFRYLHNVLGLARTSKLPNVYLKKAKTYLEKHYAEEAAFLFHHTAAMLSKDNRQVNHHLIKAFKASTKKHNTFRMANLYIGLCSNYIRLNKLDSGIFYFEKAREIMKEEHRFSHSQLFYFHLYAAFMHYTTQDVENGLPHLDRAEELAGKNDAQLMYYYQQKAHYERALGNTDEEYYYKEKYLKQKEEYHKYITEKQVIALQSVFKSDRIEKSRKYYFNPFTNLYLMMLLLIMVSIFIMYYLKHKYRRKLLNTQTLARNPWPDNGQGEYELYINKKDIPDPGMQIADNEQIGEALYVSQQDNDSKRSWDAFYHRFNRHYPGFEDKLKRKYPNLSEVNRRYCFCVMCNLPNQEVIDMLGISADAYKKAKKRLRDIFEVDSFHDLRKCLGHIQHEVARKTN